MHGLLTISHYTDRCGVLQANIQFLSRGTCSQFFRHCVKIKLSFKVNTKIIRAIHNGTIVKTYTHRVGNTDNYVFFKINIHWIQVQQHTYMIRNIFLNCSIFWNYTSNNSWNVKNAPLANISTCWIYAIKMNIHTISKIIICLGSAIYNAQARSILSKRSGSAMATNTGRLHAQ